jgi:predicted Rossmann-fold nucleotide-binding protein
VQLGIQQKPCVLANLGGYYDPLVAMFDRGVAAGFISQANREIVRVVTSIEELLGALTAPTG